MQAMASFTHPCLHFDEECLGRAVSSRKVALPRDVLDDLHVNVNLLLRGHVSAPRLEKKTSA